jgi:hypothetical protein
MLPFLLACAPPEPAPRDLDALFHDTWAHYGAKDDAGLADAIREMAALVDVDALPLEGTIDDLTLEAVVAAGLDGPDPEPARGMYSVGFVACTPEQMENILVAEDQMSLYPDNYLAYTRTYTSDRDAYAARDTHHLTWETDYTVEIPVLATYTANVLGGAHWTPDGDAGPYLFSRTAMTGPADAVQDNVVFEIDFQMEAFYPSGDGMVHAFGMWRSIAFGDLDTENDGTVDLILGGLHDWDDKTSAICAEGRI